MAKIKRSLVKSFLNTGTVSVPVWSLISAGVPAGTIAMNPKTSEETYIGEDNATIQVESYAPTMAVEATAINGDEVFEWIDAARKGRDVLEDAETEVVNVWLYETPSLTYYLAEKVAVSVQCDSFGGEGGMAAKISYTINYLGDPVIGSFSPTEEAFVAAPVDAILTTLSIGGETLTPDFADDKSWLWYTLAVANGVTEISMASTLAGATITQYDADSVEVLQAGNAALDVGDNDLTVEVVVGSETVVYTIRVTRAAA